MTAQETFVTNGFETTLTAPLTSGATTLNVASTSGAPAVPYYVVIDPDDSGSREVVLVDSTSSGTTMTISSASKRGLDGTSDTSHTSGSIVAVVPVAAHWTDINDRVDAVAASVSTDHGALTGLADDDHTQYHTTARHAAVNHNPLIDHGSISGLGDDDHTQYLTTTRHDAHDHSAALASAVLSDLSNVSAVAPTSGQVLEWNGSAWAPATDDTGGGGSSDHGTLTGLADDDHTQYQLHDQVVFSQAGTLATGTGAFRWYPPFTVTLVDIRCSVGTAPTGSGITVDVNRNGSSVFGTKPTISSGSNVGSAATPTTTSVSSSQWVTVDIDAVGSTTPGSDLLVVVRYKRS